jgi:hypothetical protein
VTDDIYYFVAMSWWGVGCRRAVVRADGWVYRRAGRRRAARAASPSVAVAVLVAGAIVGGCAADDGRDADATAVDTSVADPARPVAAVTTQVPSVATTPVTSVPPTVVSTTAPVVASPTTSPDVSQPDVSQPGNPPLDPLAPPRVTFPDDPDRQAVVDAAYAFFDAARAAQAAPADETLRTRLSATMTDPIAGRMTSFLDGLVLDGVRIIANPDSPTYLQIFEPTLQIVGTSATFDACTIDSDVQVDVTTGVTLNDLVVSGVITYRLERVGGRWQVREYEIVQKVEGANQCATRS